MQRIARYAAAALVAAGLFSSCSSSTPNTPPQQTYPSQMTFTQGESSTFQHSTLDTLPGEPTTGTPSTITSTLVFSGMVDGRSAQYERNVYSDGTPTDTGYFSQDASMNLWQKGFISSTINTLNSFGSQAGFQAPDPGWMMLAEMSAAKGASWNAYKWDTTQTISYNGLPVAIQIEVADNATMMADTTFTIGSKTYGVKHAQHVFTLTANSQLGSMASYTGYFDTYISGDLGTTVKNDRHPSQLTINPLVSSLIGYGSQKLSGSLDVMVSHQ